MTENWIKGDVRGGWIREEGDGETISLVRSLFDVDPEKLFFLLVLDVRQLDLMVSHSRPALSTECPDSCKTV